MVVKILLVILGFAILILTGFALFAKRPLFGKGTLNVGQLWLNAIAAVLALAMIGYIVVPPIAYALGNIGAAPASSSSTPDPAPADEGEALPDDDTGDYDETLAIRMDRSDIDRRYGEVSRWYLPSSRTEMADNRYKLCVLNGFKSNESLSIPFIADQDYFNVLMGWVRGENGREPDLLRLRGDLDSLETQFKNWEKEYDQLAKGDREKWLAWLDQKVVEEILRNPIFADGLVQMLQCFPAIEQANPWFSELAKLFDEAWSEKTDADGNVYMDGVYAFIEIDATGKTAEDQRPYLRTTDEYYYSVAPLAALIEDCFTNEGVMQMNSAVRWPLNMASKNSEVRAVLQDDPDKQESRNAVIYTHYDKEERVEIRFGFNWYSKDPELPAGEPSAPQTGGSTGGGTPPPPPGPTPTPDPGGDNPEYPVCPPEGDPAHKGNDDDSDFGHQDGGTGEARPTEPAGENYLDNTAANQEQQNQKNQELTEEVSDITNVPGVDPNLPNTVHGATPPPTEQGTNPSPAETGKPVTVNNGNSGDNNGGGGDNGNSTPSESDNGVLAGGGF